MKFKPHHFVALLSAGAIVLASLAWLVFDAPRVAATCGSSIVSVNILNPVANAAINGAGIPLQAQVHANTAPTSVDFQLSGTASRTLTGAGMSNPTSGGSSPINQEWTLIWDSNTVPSGGYSLTAVAHIGTNTAYDCPSGPTAISVTNVSIGPSPTPSITPATATPAPTATSANSTRPSANTATPTPKPSASPTPAPTPTPAAAAAGTAAPSVFRPTQPTNSTPLVPAETLVCLEQALGPKYQLISAGAVLPTTSDRLRADACFWGANKIPAVLAPVDPVHVNELATSAGIVRLTDAKNQTKVANGKKVTTLVLSGRATPNSSVFIYIFSDPMVLRATTDSSGKWVYELDNPLKPGEHEIYAVAEKDSQTFVRTPAWPISIAAAVPDSTEGSLVIERKLQPAQIAFAIGASVLILAATVLALWLHRRSKLAAPAEAAR